MKKLILFGIFILVMTGCQKAKYQQINLHDAKEKIKTGAYLIDVRSSYEYKKNHIRGSVNIPVEEIKNPKNKIITKKDVIIVYCQSGRRSKQAAKELIEMGYLHVYDFGSIEQWSS